MGRRLQVREDREGAEGPPPGKGKEYQKNLNRESSGVAVPSKNDNNKNTTTTSAPAKTNKTRNTTTNAAKGTTDTAKPVANENEFSLFVGNLPWTFTWRELKDLFTDFDPQHAAIKYNDGRSRGFGIVRFDRSTQNATTIIDKVNGTMVGEPPRAIVVREDRE
jgi:RNA recognition motif-containing protein